MIVAVIDIGGEVWGPYSNLDGLSRYLGMSPKCIWGQLLNPPRLFIRGFFTVMPWLGHNRDDYDLVPFRKPQPDDAYHLDHFRQRIHKYADLKGSNLIPYTPKNKSFCVVDYGEEIFGPFSYHKEFEVFFGLYQSCVGKAIRSFNPSKIVYHSKRPFIIVPADAVDQAVPLPIPSKHTLKAVQEWKKKLPQFRKSMRTFIHAGSSQDRPALGRPREAFEPEDHGHRFPGRIS